MAEFIEREKALEECDWYANEFCECEYAIMPLKGALEILPAADVRPAFRGTWGHRWICSDMSGYEYACSCSVCGKPTYRMSLLEKMPNFCPNCGADMREES